MADGGDPAALTAAAGAYALAIGLARPRRLAIARLGRPVLAPGRYVYVGSARGPGGLGARVRRHLRPHKALHWHIDHLTAVGRVLAVRGWPGALECELAARLRVLDGVEPPVPGFGSSDCRRCPAHLYLLPARLDLEAALAALAPGRGAAQAAVPPTVSASISSVG